MEVTTHLDALAAEGERMAAAAALAAPGAAVPTCPDWTVRDLVRHTGGVHRWATAYVAGARTEARDVDVAAVTGPEPPDAELVPWFRRGHAALVAALTAAPADLECWTFLPAPSPRAMWARRQAHETAIHRVDTELAAGVAVEPFAPLFAADGIDEVLTCFAPRRNPLEGAAPTTITLRCTDVDAGWLLRVDAGGLTVEALPDDDAGRTGLSTVRGAAGELYLALWNRTDTSALMVEGSAAARALFRGTGPVRWA